jgi:SAM-dependent methyltransferase
MPTYDEVIERLIPEVEHHQNRYARGLGLLVRPGSRWLDIGAGTRPHSGWKGERPHVLGQRANLAVGCDLVESHLKQNKLLHFMTVADASHLPFRDNVFDVVSANMVIEHLADPEFVFGEVSRVLVPGGHFAFVTPNRSNPTVFFASILLPRPLRRKLAALVEGRDMRHIFYTYYRANTASSVHALSSVAGFAVRDIDFFNSFPVVRRPWPATALEALWIKMISRRPLRRFTSNLYVVLQKNPVTTNANR